MRVSQNRRVGFPGWPVPGISDSLLSHMFKPPAHEACYYAAANPQASLL